MTILKVLSFPDSRLRKKAKKVPRVNSEITSLVSDMFDTMYSELGVGLAATQVGRLERILVIDISEERDQPQEFINPEIRNKNGMQIHQEGCLSFPGVFADVERAHYIELTWLDRFGLSHTDSFYGFAAVCIQHEIDHLNGILFIDHLSIDMQKRAKQLIGEHIANKTNHFSLQREGSEIKAVALQ